MALAYQPCQELRTIPEDKIKIIKNEIITNCKNCSSKTSPHEAEPIAKCDVCLLKFKISDRYFNSNIPMDYWDKEMKDFQGDKRVVKAFTEISSDFKKFYADGNSLLLVGNHGVGKTFFSCNVLKLAAVQGFGALYTTMGDMTNVLIYGNSKVKFDARRELMMVSFLVIDEFDSRFIGSDAAGELFGRVMESILRIRLQNHIPTILVSNNLDPTTGLSDYFKASLGSLMSSSQMKRTTVIGSDFRKNNG